jgi:alkanesulfonate monooxygenase SsuD/methylene tetrahydromethanopterin reductase-like flavin-dependent oxidoreductase (luciferase family)
MKVGITLPSFRDSAEPALEAALRAEELGIDGVFVFDHIWPMGRPDLPALSTMPLLGAIAAVTDHIVLGPLVARVGMLPDFVLVEALESLSRMAPGRVVAGLGTGDRKSADENRRYGIDYAPVEARMSSLRNCAAALKEDGIPVWLGGESARIAGLAAELGVALNLWDAEDRRISAEAESGRVPEVTWGGEVGSGGPATELRLRAVAGLGASWAVCAWPRSLEEVAAGAARLRR